jgi:4-amino-4-deoxy-L-arabinose transferase-like glycosyltransferase
VNLSGRSRLAARHVVLVLGACLVLRLAFFAVVQPWRPSVERRVVLHHDALEYHELAVTVLTSGRFAYGPAAPPSAFRTPGYPLFVAGAYALFGHEPWAVLLVQAFLDTFTCLLLMSALTRLLGTRIGLIGGGFYAVDPALVIHCATLLSEVLFLWLLVGAFYAFSLAATCRRSAAREGACAASGLLMGLGVLVRPVGQFAALLYIVFLVAAGRGRVAKRLGRALLWALAFAVVLAPWVVRNAQTFGRAALATTPSFYLLREQVGAMEVARRGSENATEVRDALLAEAREMMAADGHNPETLSPFQRADYQRRLALRYIQAHPVRCIFTTLRGVVHTFASPGTEPFAQLLRIPHHRLNVKRYRSLLQAAKKFLRSKSPTELAFSAVAFAFLAGSYAGVALGFLLAWRHPRRAVLLFCMSMALYFVLAAGGNGLVRFRLPAIPFYLPFVGLGYAWLSGKVWRRPNASEKPENGPADAAS